MLARLRTVDPLRAERLSPQDRKRILRAMEYYRLTGETLTEHDRRTRAQPPRYAALRVVLDYENRETLNQRIDERVEEMIQNGLFEEVQRLLQSGLSPECTAMQAIDKVKDTSASHERCSVIEVMGRNAGYIALWCGIANGAEDILIPEKYDFNEQNIINNIIANRRRGKTHHIVINAEGIGHSVSMARRIEAATGIETRATILGYMQRGGQPTAKDRYYASIMGAYAVDILMQGKTNRVVGFSKGEFVDYDIEEALNMEKGINEYQFEVAHLLSY